MTNHTTKDIIRAKGEKEKVFGEMKKVVVVNFLDDKYRKYGYVLKENKVNSYVQFADEQKWVDNGDIVVVPKRKEKANAKKISELRMYMQQYDYDKIPKWLRKVYDRDVDGMNNYQVNALIGFFKSNMGNLAEYLEVVGV